MGLSGTLARRSFLSAFFDLWTRLFHCEDGRRGSKLVQPGPRAEIQ